MARFSTFSWQTFYWVNVQPANPANTNTNLNKYHMDITKHMEIPPQHQELRNAPLEQSSWELSVEE